MEEVRIQLQNPLKIISKKFINPAIPTPFKLRNFKISCLDQLLPSVFLHFVFFYPSTEINQVAAKNEERIKQMENSLSEVLTLFYPLAGRYIKDNLLVDCNDHGVEFKETQVGGHHAPLLGRDVDSKQLNHLVPNYQTESPSSPLIAVQCNMFDCGGLAIGFCFSHRIVDGFGITKFLDGWATACREGLHKVDRPSFDLATLLPRRDVLPDIKMPRFVTGLKVRSKTFVFDGPAITNLKEIARGGLDDAEVLKRQTSRVQLVTAVIWKALINVSEIKHGQLRPSVISHTVNMRGRTSPPVSDDCFRNFFGPIMVQFIPNNEKSKVEFQDLVILIGDAITNSVADCAKPKSGNEFFSMLTSAWNVVGEEFHKDNVDAYSFTSLCRMPFYPDFGWGKAARVTHVQSFVEVIMLLDTRDGEGIEAWISLEENKLCLFQQDPDILAFTSHVTPVSLTGNPKPEL